VAAANPMFVRGHHPRFMKAGQASKTAQHMALFRAIESARPSESRIINDPFAARFLKRSFRLVLGLSRLPLLGNAVPRLIDAIAPGARSSGVARTRVIDELVKVELQRGLEQIVILGAGYDCRAYRIDEAERVRVYELDHPSTLAQKFRVFPPSFSRVQYVGVDFNRQTASEVLDATDYNAAVRTLFIWEGVTNYLSAAAVDKVVRWLGTAAPGSSVVFTYVHSDVLRHPQQFYGAKRLLRRFERIGEPWQFGLDPNEVSAYLVERGLDLIQDVGAAEYCSRYLSSRGDTARGYEFYRVALARVCAQDAATSG
jgi:methyltransferase (TIGR00027 family)